MDKKIMYATVVMGLVLSMTVYSGPKKSNHNGNKKIMSRVDLPSRGRNKRLQALLVTLVQQGRPLAEMAYQYDQFVRANK
jgi:hypothetical protein